MASSFLDITRLLYLIDYNGKLPSAPPPKKKKVTAEQYIPRELLEKPVVPTMKGNSLNQYQDFFLQGNQYITVESKRHVNYRDQHENTSEAIYESGTLGFPEHNDHVYVATYKCLTRMAKPVVDIEVGNKLLAHKCMFASSMPRK